MAYAAITSILKGLVRDRIHMLKVAELSTLTDPSTIIPLIQNSRTLREHAQQLLWNTTEPDLRERLEKYNKEGQIRFKFIVPAEYSSNSEMTREVVESFAKGQVIPCTVAMNDGYGVRTRDSICIDFNQDPLFQHYAEAHKNYIECSNRWEAVTTQVINFLNSCKSANEALKLWPDVARYMPKETLERVNLKSEKKEKDASAALTALQNIDMDSVNTSTVLARMAGARI